MVLTPEDLQQLPEDGLDPENPGPYLGLLSDLQATILQDHGRNYSVHLFLRFQPDRLADVKQWIQTFAQAYITSAQQQAEQDRKSQQDGIPGGMIGNFLLSRWGYEYLSIKPFKIPADQPFRMGMKNGEVRSLLGDPGVEEWEPGFQAELHALVMLAEDDQAHLLQVTNQLIQSLQPMAEVVHREDGFVLRNREQQVIEHFGFVHGISQPLFLKDDIAAERDRGHHFDQWDPRAPLELLLVKDPNGKTEDSYGSYLVYRKLEQNVKAFREDQQHLAKQLHIDEDLAGALVMGRFQDGTPVTLTDMPAHAVAATNNFNYEEDQHASKCPFHAHIRKMNPRGDTGRVVSSQGFEEALQVERKHRIARRGWSYGEHDPTKEPEIGAGMLFLCFQADIENQFNFMQTRWANAKNFVQVNVGPDPVIGQPAGTQQWPKQWGESDTEQHDFSLKVNMKGGEYFFAPSISFLRAIAS